MLSPSFYPHPFLRPSDIGSSTNLLQSTCYHIIRLPFHRQPCFVIPSQRWSWTGIFFFLPLLLPFANRTWRHTGPPTKDITPRRAPPSARGHYSPAQNEKLMKDFGLLRALKDNTVNQAIYRPPQINTRSLRAVCTIPFWHLS